MVIIYYYLHVHLAYLVQHTGQCLITAQLSRVCSVWNNGTWEGGPLTLSKVPEWGGVGSGGWGGEVEMWLLVYIGWTAFYSSFLLFPASSPPLSRTTALSASSPSSLLQCGPRWGGGGGGVFTRWAVFRQWSWVWGEPARGTYPCLLRTYIRLNGAGIYTFHALHLYIYRTPP